MIPRIAENELRKLASRYKAVAITGPRQSGKTTLVRKVFSDREYVSLENPDTRNFALEDPRGFLSQYQEGAVFDEVQRVPDLFSYLQQVLDESNEPGKFILTGSNNFLLQENISQSLAGRIGYLTLLPFSIDEPKALEDMSVNDVLFKGMYPPLYDVDFDTTQWYSNYIHTYIERDIRQLRNITDLLVFEKFVRLCAGRIGQLLNMHSLAIETGVDSKTIHSWIGLLETSFIVFRLAPHHQNFNKRIVKMPKLYFYDTGLACALLGIQNARQLQGYPLRGSLFENLCIVELLKKRFNQGKVSNLYFWRDNTGHEIDILVEKGGGLFPIEIKSGQTVTTDYFKGLNFWKKISNTSEGVVIYAGDQSQKRSDGRIVIPWRNMGAMDV